MILLFQRGARLDVPTIEDSLESIRLGDGAKRSRFRNIRLSKSNIIITRTRFRDRFITFT